MSLETTLGQFPHSKAACWTLKNDKLRYINSITFLLSHFLHWCKFGKISSALKGLKTTTRRPRPNGSRLISFHLLLLFIVRQLVSQLDRQVCVPIILLNAATFQPTTSLPSDTSSIAEAAAVDVFLDFVTMYTTKLVDNYNDNQLSVYEQLPNLCLTFSKGLLLLNQRKCY